MQNKGKARITQMQSARFELTYKAGREKVTKNPLPYVLRHKLQLLVLSFQQSDVFPSVFGESFMTNKSTICLIIRFIFEISTSCCCQPLSNINFSYPAIWMCIFIFWSWLSAINHHLISFFNKLCPFTIAAEIHYLTPVLPNPPSALSVSEIIEVSI